MIYLIFYKWAVMKADLLHKISRGQQQYYVLKYKGRLKVLSAKQIRMLKKRGAFNKHFNWYKLQEIALYKTK